MSIEKYREKKREFQNVEENLLAATQRRKVDDGTVVPHSSNDKGRISLSFMEMKGDTALISLSARHGFYGNSSTSNNMNKLVAEYFIKAIEYMSSQIADKAIDLARAEYLKAKKEAESEATEILAETKED